jgi:Domain of Unknown Function (DUF928)
MLLNCKKGLFFFLWLFVSWTSYLMPQNVYASNNQKAQAQTNSSQEEKDPPSRGTPPAKEGTGSRGDCGYKQGMLPLTRIVGSNQLKSTINGHPTIWVYLPYTSVDAKSGEFSLHDGDIELYRTRFRLPDKAGIISVNLPNSAPEVAVGKEYRWYFEVNCNGAIYSSTNTPASVTGLIKRQSTPVELARHLEKANNPLEKISAYAKYGIWYETITELAKLRLKEPQNQTLRNMWIEFLSAEKVSLAHISQQPIIGNLN